MIVNERGSVKFSCDHIRAELPPFDGFDELKRVRQQLVELGWLGIDANGIGFGNLSVRAGDSSQFYITGSGTGGLTDLSPSNCAKVVAWNFAKNWVRCEGEKMASSESLTHAAVYESAQTARGVIHVHDCASWRALLNKVATTAAEAEYGTPEMAFAVKRLFETSDVKQARIFVMGGHEGGVVAFGEHLNEAFARLEAALISDD